MASETTVGSLKDFIRGTYKGPALNCSHKSIIRQVGKGIAHLHTKNIVHRDLKPSNILISLSDGSIYPRFKLSLNFGVTRINRRTGSIPLWKLNNGSKSWMPAEIYIINQFIPEIDIFAFGCTVGFILSNGKHIFGEDKEERIIRIKRKEPIVLTARDLNLETDLTGGFELILTMVHPDPCSRPSISKLMDHPFLKQLASSKKKNNLPSIPQWRLTRLLNVQSNYSLSATTTDEEFHSPYEQVKQPSQIASLFEPEPTLAHNEVQII